LRASGRGEDLDAPAPNFVVLLRLNEDVVAAVDDRPGGAGLELELIAAELVGEPVVAAELGGLEPDRDDAGREARLPEPPDRLATADRLGGRRQECRIRGVERGERFRVRAAEGRDEGRARLCEGSRQQSGFEVAGDSAQRRGRPLQFRCNANSDGDREFGTVERFFIA
jgi:hypothetical protein